MIKKTVCCAFMKINLLWPNLASKKNDVTNQNKFLSLYYFGVLILSIDCQWNIKCRKAKDFYFHFSNSK